MIAARDIDCCDYYERKDLPASEFLLKGEKEANTFVSFSAKEGLYFYSYFYIYFSLISSFQLIEGAVGMTGLFYFLIPMMAPL